MELEVRIERLGAQGDGLAQGPDGPLFVPFTLPGELVKVAAEPGEPRAEALAILEPSPERIAPVCQYFGTCGGCALQHMEAGAYLAWKREQVVAALASRGLEAPVEEVRAVPLASRRRAALRAWPHGSMALPSATAPPARTPLSTSPPARCSAQASPGACPSSNPRSRRCLVASAKRASPSRRPSRASMWWSRAYAPRLRCSPSWPRRVQASGLPASRSMARASFSPASQR